MDRVALRATLAGRFRLKEPPVLLARTKSETPIVFAHLQSTLRVSRRTSAPPPEAAFTMQVNMEPLAATESWVDGRHIKLGPIPPGGLFLFDLSTTPVTLFNDTFNFIRFYISQRTIEDLAYETGFCGVGGLRASTWGNPDPVMHGLALTLLARARNFGEADSLFIDQIGLAFYAHIIHAYGNAVETSREWRGGLAPWQLRRAAEFLTAHLADDPSINEIARECELSASHFARAFKQTTGLPPHRWLMDKRLQHAKDLLQQSTLALTDIAEVCGFADQSHLTRVFSRCEGTSPGRWRRLSRA